MWMYGWYRPTNKHLVMKYTYKTTTNSGEQSIKGTIAERSEWWCLAQHIIVFGRIFYIYSRYLSWWYMYRLFKSCGGNTTVLKCTDMLSNKPTTLYTSKLMVSYDLPRQQLILAKEKIKERMRGWMMIYIIPIKYKCTLIHNYTKIIQ